VLDFVSELLENAQKTLETYFHHGIKKVFIFYKLAIARKHQNCDDKKSDNFFLFFFHAVNKFQQQLRNKIQLNL